MAKKVKAIELVFMAQPAMALVLKLLKKECKENDPIIKDIQKWLHDERELLKLKEREL